MSCSAKDYFYEEVTTTPVTVFERFGNPKLLLFVNEDPTNKVYVLVGAGADGTGVPSPTNFTFVVEENGGQFAFEGPSAFGDKVTAVSLVASPGPLLNATRFA